MCELVDISQQTIDRKIMLQLHDRDMTLYIHTRAHARARARTQTHLLYVELGRLLVC